MDLPQLLRIGAGTFFGLTLIYTGVIIWRLRRAQATAASASPAAPDIPLEEYGEPEDFPPYEDESLLRAMDGNGSSETDTPLDDFGAEPPAEPFPAGAEGEERFFAGSTPESPDFDFDSGFATAELGETSDFSFADADAAGNGDAADDAAVAPVTVGTAGVQDAIPPAIMEWVQSADEFEAYPPGHARRVAELAKQLGRALMLAPGEIALLEAAALLHDVGMVNHDGYIREDRPLAEHEWENLRMHPLRSEQTILQLPNLEKAATWVRHHHERWDGRGYPDRLKGEKIPMASRILAVADTWEAMTHDRPHRPAFSEFDAKEELRRLAGSHFDPVVIKAFLPMIGPTVDDEIVMRLRRRITRAQELEAAQ